MTLRDRLVAQIKAQGPISVADYMQICLMDPTDGYYTTRPVFGADGDFTTAPEISQMFGEMLGLALAQAWMDQGAVERFTLAELGPGRGTLMADMLRATRSIPGFHDAAHILLVETSAQLRKLQNQTLKGNEIHWADSVAALPEQPLFLVANEFFDALPVRQFLRSGRGWRERQVGVETEQLCFGLGPEQPQPALASRLEDTQDGDLVEDCAAAAPIVATLSARIARFGGAALIVDYGDWHSLGDTLQALRNHQAEDVLAEPGQADLTAHVDFEALALASAPARHSRVTPQGVFLERLGITQRAQTLAAGMSGEQLDSHIAAHRRLTHPQEMGNLFKVLGITPSRAHMIPGLDP